MNGAKDIRSYGYKVGSIPCGKANLITDVPGVKVGHCTVEENGHKTGVTAVIPCDGNVFVKKPVASVFTLNGYGKTAGTIQIEELGVIETPICLTNTLNVGKVSDALVEYTIQKCAGDHIKVRSINPVVGETNDSLINPIQERVVEVHHVIQALESASEAFEQGCVGAGRGTVCCGLKGGIGSSSRVLDFAGKTYTLGALVQSNFGRMEDLMICGQPVGNRIAQELHPKNSKDEGSIMIIIGTDIPLSARQLKRVLKRAAVGLVRTGSYMGHGSGKLSSGSRKRETSFDFVLSGRSAGSGFPDGCGISRRSNLQFIDLCASGNRSRWKNLSLSQRIFARACLKKAFCKMCVTICGGFCVEI